MACVSTLFQKSLQRGKERSRPSRFPPLNLFRRCRQPQSDDPTCRGRHQHTPALNALAFRLGRSTRRHVAFKCDSMMSALLRSVSYYEDIPESFHAPPMSSIVALTPQYSDLLQCHIWKVQWPLAATNKLVSCSYSLHDAANTTRPYTAFLFADTFVEDAAHQEEPHISACLGRRTSCNYCRPPAR